MGPGVSRADIRAAADRIEGHVRRTPIADLGDALDSGYRLSLKLDSLQPTGSFKVRGAFAFLTARVIPDAGVVAASGGNFGLAIAYAAGELGHKATIFVPSTSPQEKIGRLSGLGAEVQVIDGYYNDALRASQGWAAESGAIEAHAFDQPEVVAGQGTLAREITGQVPEVAAVLVAVGGGGLLAGVASWIQDDAIVVGVEPELCPALHRARGAGEPVEAEVGGVAASSLGASKIGDQAWLANQWVDAAHLVSDPAILEAQRWLWDTCRVMAEPGACTTIAALITGSYKPGHGEHVVAVISGANTGPLEPQV